jgi:anti-anti-sigma factor
MKNSAFPVTWAGRQAVVELPEHIAVIEASQLREQLLVTLNQGAAVLIVDMTKTASCDHAGVDALARAYQRAAVTGAQVRVVVSAPVIRRVLSIEGIDRVVSVYPTLESAIAAGPARAAGFGRQEVRPAGEGLPGARQQAAGQTNGRVPAALSPAVLWQLLDALGDGLVLTDHDGTIVMANRRCAEMFGYGRDELVGQPVESLVPADMRAAHQRLREEYAVAPVSRPMADRVRLVGVRKDGASVPVEISLAPVPTAGSHLVLAVIRDATDAWRRQDIVDLVRAAVAEPGLQVRDLLDRVVDRLFHVGLSLQAATDLPADLAKDRITEALDQLDDTILQIRDHSLGLGDTDVARGDSRPKEGPERPNRPETW